MSDPRNKATVNIPSLSEKDHQVLHQLQNYTLTPQEINVLQSTIRSVAESTLFGFLMFGGVSAYVTTKRKWIIAPKVIVTASINYLLIFF
jgi:hypothetical protein